MLESYLSARLTQGDSLRNRRMRRYAKIDKAISTWMKLNADDSARLTNEEQSGKPAALPFNMPILVTHLNDMVSFFSEVLAPISNPFTTKSGDAMPAAVTEKLNRDATKHGYYAELSLTLRSLFKYNWGGQHVEWDDDGSEDQRNAMASPGNVWKALDPYNTFWDPSIRDLSCFHKKGEWGATIDLVNRMEILRNHLSGKWARLEPLLEKNYESDYKGRYYKEPSSEAGIGIDGAEGRTGKTSKAVNWEEYGLGIATQAGPDVDGFERVVMYCWLIPARFGLLTDAERKQLEDMGKNPEVFLELWKFELIGGTVVSAKTQIDRDDYLQDEPVCIPMFLSYLTQDQLNEAQKSMMELMQGFQRFSNNMYNIYIQGMRKQVWGLKGVDPTMFDTTALQSGDVVGILKSKKPGADVRLGMVEISTSAGVENVLGSIEATLGLKDRMFPTQALPSQVAGIDRAVKSQVASVMQGSTRSLKAMLRILDASLMLSSRIEAFLNLIRHDNEGIAEITVETFAKQIGSGLESLEAERISEALWQLLYAIIQNQEAMQVFNIPAIFAYIGQISNLSTNLEQFVRQQPEPQGQTAPTPPQQ
ncbi:portal protein [Biomphalaria pfeifferi]|uniref:Portal protein n=1 Tax=Biomphalaria pfeifferi TaxID=112525 RepID=A0AAD8EUP9_BIOPF|nr:portal protein [Biomphalaria pfeifferi]